MQDIVEVEKGGKRNAARDHFLRGPKLSTGALLAIVLGSVGGVEWWTFCYSFKRAAAAQIRWTFCAIMQQRARSGFETCDQLLLLRSRPPTKKRFRGELLSLVFIEVASYTSNLKCVAWFAD
jgi:hypothetical protein